MISSLLLSKDIHLFYWTCRYNTTYVQLLAYAFLNDAYSRLFLIRERKNKSRSCVDKTALWDTGAKQKPLNSMRIVGREPLSVLSHADCLDWRQWQLQITFPNAQISDGSNEREKACKILTLMQNSTQRVLSTGNVAGLLHAYIYTYFHYPHQCLYYSCYFSLSDFNIYSILIILQFPSISTPNLYKYTLISTFSYTTAARVVREFYDYLLDFSLIPQTPLTFNEPVRPKGKRVWKSGATLCYNMSGKKSHLSVLLASVC